VHSRYVRRFHIKLSAWSNGPVHLQVIKKSISQFLQGPMVLYILELSEDFTSNYMHGLMVPSLFKYSKKAFPTFYMVQWSCTFLRHHKISHQPLCMVQWSLAFSSNYKKAVPTFYMFQWSSTFLGCPKISHKPMHGLMVTYFFQ
jgi:hypothetical protein